MADAPIRGIRAHCRVCHFSIHLAELVRATFLEGHCPSCGCPLAGGDDPHPMLKEAARAVRAHRELVESIRVLVRRPGNLELIPHTIVRDLYEAVDWPAEIAGDRDLVQREVEELQRYLRVWSALSGDEEREGRSELLGRLERVAFLLRRRGDHRDQELTARDA